LLFVETANQSITTPSGWTEVSASPQGTGTAAAAGGVRLGVFWKITSGTESNRSVVDSGDHNTGVMLAFRGVDTNTPIDAAAGSVQASAATSWTLPAVTTTTADTMIVLAIGNDRDINSTANVDGYTNPALTNITERVDQTTSIGFGGGIAVVTAELASAGSSGTTSCTNAASNTAAFVTVALRPLVSQTGKSASDGGSGGDSVLVRVLAGISDLGAGADIFAGAAAQVPVTDAGTALAALQIQATVLLMEAASGVDVPLLRVRLGLSDLGQSIEALGVLTATLLAVNDVGVSMEALSAFARASVIDTASATDTPLARALLALSDAGAAVDLASLHAALALNDVGVSMQALSAFARASVGDTASATDTRLARALLALSDGGAAIDIAGLRAALALNDVGVSMQALSAFAWASVSDAASATDTPLALALLALSDGGAAVDMAGLHAALALKDQGSAGEAVALRVRLTISDLGAGAEGVRYLSEVLKVVADVVAGSDHIHTVSIQVGLADTGMGVDLVQLAALVQVLQQASGLDVVLRLIAARIAKIDVSLRKRTAAVIFTQRRAAFFMRRRTAQLFFN
jgi:hypothetical protein